MHAVNATLAACKTVYAVEYKVFIPDDRDAGNKWLISGRKAFALRSENQDAVLNSILKSKAPTEEPSDRVGAKDDLPHDPSYPQGTLFNN